MIQRDPKKGRTIAGSALEEFTDIRSVNFRQTFFEEPIGPSE
jgi:hypothetical protein